MNIEILWRLLYMKKLINTSIFYSILALCSGVFYREFTKFNDFVGVTTLSFTHVHAFMLGMFMFLVLILFNKQFDITSNKGFNSFYYIYNLGLIGMIIMLYTRGIAQVLNVDLSSALNASISGISGIAHILLGIGVVQILFIIKKQIKIEDK